MPVLVNLLPDVRQAKLRARHRRQLTASLGTLICVGSVGLVVVLFLITGAQKLRLNQLQGQIDGKKAQLNERRDLQKWLNTQQNLASLPGLYDKRIAVTKFFQVLQAVTPTQLTIDNLNVDAENVLKASGEAASYSTVTKFAKALEASGVEIQTRSGTPRPDFENVLITSVSQQQNTGRISFTISLKVSTEVTGGQ